ncbi:MAG: PEP-CTERM sorting domain-containing protein, partial [Rhodoglobus sp.]
MAGNAWAFGPYTNTQVCGGSAGLFQTCATLTTALSVDGKTLMLTVKNTGTLGDKFTAIGIGAVPTGVTVTGTSSTSNFTFTGAQTDLSNGVDKPYYGFSCTGNPANCLPNNGTSIVFTFTFSGAVTLSDLALGIHSQGSTVGDCSTKLFVNSGTTLGVDGGNYTTRCGSPTTTVPEPMTMSLLATGLVGMGGMGAFKR